MRSSTHKSRGIAASLALAITFAACDPEPDPGPQPPAPDAALAFGDDAVITHAEIAAFFPYFDSWDPRLGKKARIRAVLTKELVPIALARADFAEQRAEQRTRAENLRSVVGNYLELKDQGGAFGGEEPDRPYSRSSLPYAVARWAFADENIGAVSPPIETANGYLLVAVRDIIRGGTTISDLVHMYSVPFPTHEGGDFHAWLKDAKATAKDAITYVHPDIADALPIWLQ